MSVANPVRKVGFIRGRIVGNQDCAGGDWANGRNYQALRRRGTLLTRVPCAFLLWF
jgi:hypothetical protein